MLPTVLHDPSWASESNYDILTNTQWGVLPVLHYRIPRAQPQRQLCCSLSLNSCTSSWLGQDSNRTGSPAALPKRLSLNSYHRLLFLTLHLNRQPWGGSPRNSRLQKGPRKTRDRRGLLSDLPISAQGLGGNRTWDRKTPKSNRPQVPLSHLICSLQLAS